MALYSRNELALFMDFKYGLKDGHNITDFDSFFKQTGLDDKLLSTDALVANKGIQELIAKYPGDFHSSLLHSSAYAGKEALDTIKSDATLKSPSYQEYQMIRYAYSTARANYFKALYSEEAPACYETYGKDTDSTTVKDTAYITFDHFSIPSSGTDYYKTAPTAAATDTFGILAYAYSQIAADTNIKNIVLDLSCNGGGSLNAGIYTAGAFLPYGILHAEDTTSGAMGEFTYHSDLNLDGKYDASDYFFGLAQKRSRSFKLYCLTSPASLSCSNFVASAFKESNQIRLIGGNTSGGACIVENGTTADGTYFRTSGNSRLCTMRNGAYQPIEDGIKVDYSLDGYDDYFNRTKLTNFIENL
jgi:hypothetical protein